MSPFDIFIDPLIKAEGGYVDNPDDNGGPTKYGITLATLSDWRKQNCTALDVFELHIIEAKQIYKKKYWDPVRGDELPFALAFLVADAAVNSGPIQAIRWLQKALRLSSDGIFGPITLARAQNCTLTEVVPYMVSQRLQLMVRHEDYAKFGDGWFRRVVLKVMQAMTTETGV